MRTAKTLIRLGECPGWSESLLVAQVNLFVLSCSGSFVLEISLRCLYCIVSSISVIQYENMLWLSFSYSKNADKSGSLNIFSPPFLSAFYNAHIHCSFALPSAMKFVKIRIYELTCRAHKYMIASAYQYFISSTGQKRDVSVLWWRFKWNTWPPWIGKTECCHFQHLPKVWIQGHWTSR